MKIHDTPAALPLYIGESVVGTTVEFDEHTQVVWVVTKWGRVFRIWSTDDDGRGKNFRWLYKLVELQPCGT